MPVATYHICAGGRSVLELEARPGTLHSTAAPPADWTPPPHPFVHGVATDAPHEHALGELLRDSSDVVDFLRRVVASPRGYDVVDGSVSRWDLEGGQRRITRANGAVVGVAFPLPGPLATLSTEVAETRETYAHALVCVYDDGALAIVRNALARSDTFDGFGNRLAQAGLLFVMR